MLPDQAEVRKRQLCLTAGCHHPKTSHATPINLDGHCTLPGCVCIGFDPMSDEEWAAVFDAQRRGLL